MDALGPLDALLTGLTTRLAAVETKLGITPPAAGAGAGASSAPEELRADVQAFDAMKPELLQPFLDSAKAVGGDAAELATIVGNAFDENRNFLLMASRCKKPPMRSLRDLADPIAKCIKAANDKKDRGSDWFNHQSAVAGGIGAFQWVIISPAPAPIVEACRDDAEFYLNKVRMMHRGKNPDQMNFCATFKKLLDGMYNFVKEHHKMGLDWNPRGGDATAFAPPSSASAPAPAPAPAPAAPKPAPGAGAGAAGGGAHLSDVFSQLKKIDQSGGRTAGLRKVTKDMKSKGASGAVPAAKPKASPPTRGAAAATPAKPPRCELVKKRWFIEYQTGPEPLYLDDVTQDQEIYIYKCTNATIVINKKVKAMQVDSCTKCQVVYESAVSAVEIVNCQRLKTQVKGRVPSIAVDKTDGCVIYLSYASREAQIVTSKCSELNVSYPTSDAEDADWTEAPIPEQFVTTLQADGSLKTEVSGLYH